MKSVQVGFVSCSSTLTSLRSFAGGDIYGPIILSKEGPTNKQGVSFLPKNTESV